MTCGVARGRAALAGLMQKTPGSPHLPAFSQAPILHIRPVGWVSGSHGDLFMCPGTLPNVLMPWMTLHTIEILQQKVKNTRLGVYHTLATHLSGQARLARPYPGGLFKKVVAARIRTLDPETAASYLTALHTHGRNPAAC